MGYCSILWRVRVLLLLMVRFFDAICTGAIEACFPLFFTRTYKFTSVENGYILSGFGGIYSIFTLLTALFLKEKGNTRCIIILSLPFYVATCFFIAPS